MKRTSAILVTLVFSLVTSVDADYTGTDQGTWPKIWPAELEPLRKQASTFSGPTFELQHYAIPFTKQNEFESAWPHLLKVKSKGAPIMLRRGPSFWLGDKATAGVCVHTPPTGQDPIADGKDAKGNWEQTIYIELIVDGEIIDLNRIPLPADTPIIDERFKDVRLGMPMSAQDADRSSVSAGTKLEMQLKPVTFEFRWCPPGQFLMGSPPGSESKYGDRFVQEHKVEITRGYWMMATEVTQAQYAAIMGYSPSSWKGPKMTQHPVEQVSWGDAVRFCDELSALDKKHEYRLPTEAEWEYACRAGGAECRYGDILEIAWVFQNTDEGEGSDGHRPVGTKTPNRWGFHDMFGNVSEWCADWWAPPAREHQTDPRGPAHGEMRVVRGDDCFVDSVASLGDGACMAGARMAWPSATASRLIGFRIVRVPIE